MNHIKITSYLISISLLILSSCTKKLALISDKSDEEIASTYTTRRDIAYGSDIEQIMDIYLSKDMKSYSSNNFTIVFLHGGGYYLSDKRQEEKYIQPYLKKGLNVVNMNYQLKKGIPIATADLTKALNYLKEKNSDFNLNLKNVIVTGFSAGAHIATSVGLSQNNPKYPNKLNNEIKITGIINFSGPVDGLDVVEKIFSDHENEMFSQIGKALFPTSDGYEAKEKIAVYEPINYFDKNDPPLFLWYGGKDNQILPETFAAFIPLLSRDKDFLIYSPNGQHSPNQEEFENAYTKIFAFLDKI